MKNFIQENTQITVETIKEVFSGELVVIGSLIGVACHNAKVGKDLTITTQGVFDFLSPTSFEVGDEVHLKDDEFSKKAVGSIRVGVCVKHYGETVRLRLA